MSDNSTTPKEQRRLNDAIIHLNRFKITKPDEETMKQCNDLQRKLEELAGVTAVELDNRYANE